MTFVITVIFFGVFSLILIWILGKRQLHEGFSSSLDGISLQELSTQALDSVPTTSEAKQHYKTFLLFAANDLQKQGTDGLRLLADFRDRLFGVRDFRSDLTSADFIEPYPEWLPPLDPTLVEPVPSAMDAVNSEARLLAYLQKNFPIEDKVDAQTGSVVRGIIQDFGERFVFESGQTVVLRDDFLKVPLLRNWVNPIQMKR